MNKTTIELPGQQGEWGSYISKYQPESNKVLDNMFTAGSKNFVTDQTGMIDKRQGGVQWNRTSFPEAAKDTYEAVFESGARHFLRVGGGVLSASTGTGLFDTITSGYSTFGNFEWATFQNRTYGCNGVNAPQTYDIATSYGGVPYVFTTAKTKVMGAQAPLTAPTSGAYTAGGSVPNGSHTYKVTFVYYESEESNGSPASAVQTAGAGNNTGHLSSIPTGGYGVTARNIYRDNNDGVYLLLDTILDNTTTTYTDTLLIGSTPTPIPQFNNVPPTFSKIALWLDSLFIAPTGETSIIRYSNSGSPDIFDPDNQITCQSDDVITALYVYNGKLYVFGLHSFGSIEGTTPDTFYYHSISTLIGCVDNRSIQVRSIVSVPTLWWLSDKGFYFSNGNTVEYGSDFIQDLVNLNLAQVNYSTNKNTQSSLADFSGDTYTDGIDITSSPGSVKTINPTEVFSSNADWLGGETLTNVKTSNGNFLEVPTKYAPTAASGSLTGQATVSGSNLSLTLHADFTGEDHLSDPILNGQDFIRNLAQTANATNGGQRITPPRSGTLTSLSLKPTQNIGSTVSYNISISVGSQPSGSPIYSNTVSISNPGPTTQPIYTLSGLSVSLTGGTTYFIMWDSTNHSLSTPITSAVAHTYGASAQFLINGVWQNGYSQFSPFTQAQSILMAYTYVTSPVAATGTWTSPVYDSGALSSVPGTFTETGSYPSGTSATVTVQSSAASNMSSPNTQVIGSPNGNTALTLTGLRYYRIIVQLDTTDDRITPTLGTPSFTFNITGEWTSQPIDATTDNTGWSSLTYTGNVPFGTSATLTIATATVITGPYSSFGPVGSAITTQYAKVRITLTTTSDNVTSPSITSITLNWAVTSSITSSAIDTGTLPAGFGVFQWEQAVLGVGMVTAEIRTATTALGLSSATYVSVVNGEFPALTALQFVQWRLTLSSTPNTIPEITSVTVNWFVAAGTVGVRCASIFYNKTYSISVATTGSTANNTLIQLDQFGKWRIQKDASIGTFLSYFNTLYFTDGITDLIFNGFIAATDNGVPIVMDVRTKAWTERGDIFLKVPRGLKIMGINTGTKVHAYYSPSQGITWYEMLTETGQLGYQTNTSGEEFTTLFVPDGATLTSGRSLMYRIVSDDEFPCSIIDFDASMYTRRGRYLNNGQITA